MNSTSPSLLAKVLAAALGFGLMAAVPLVTMQYAVRAHAQTPVPTLAAGECARDCPADAASCGSDRASCPKPSCPADRCLAP